MFQTEFKPATFVFFKSHKANMCRCGMESLDEACHVCEQYVCQDCATFIDPDTKQPTRPSRLLARRVHKNFLAHQGCTASERAMPCIHNQDIPLMIQILKGQPGIGRSLRVTV